MEPESKVEQPQEEQKITKVKSPGRVAAGKKLAEMNKKNKAKKEEKVEEKEEESFINPGYVIGALGVAIAAGSLYLQWRATKKVEPPTYHAPVHAPVEPAVRKSKIPEME